MKIVVIGGSGLIGKKPVCPGPFDASASFQPTPTCAICQKGAPPDSIFLPLASDPLVLL